MDDLTQQLQKVLSDPQTMGQLQGLLSSLGGQEEKPAPAPSGGPDLSALLGALGGGQASPPPAESPSTALAGINPRRCPSWPAWGPCSARPIARTTPPGCCGHCAPCWGRLARKRWTKPSRFTDAAAAAPAQGERRLFRAAVRLL